MEGRGGSSASARRAALALVRSAERFLLVGHQRPDGDVLGSEVALAGVLTALGKHATVLNPDPADPAFDFLAEEVELGADDGGPLPRHDVAVFLDFSELQRTGALAERLADAPSKKLVVDHHLFAGEPWWDAEWRDSGAAATGVMVARLAAELGVEPTGAAARGLFVSLATDTGWFRHANTDAETLGLAARLVAGGVRPDEVHARLFQRRSPDEPLALARMLARVAYHEDGRIALVEVPLSLGVPDELSEGDGVLDVLRAVAPVEMALFVREREPGVWRLSARAKGAANVHGLARRFGGGGHAKAAGATLSGSRDAVVLALLSAASDELAAASPPARGGGRR